MKQALKELALRLYKLINRLPFNNKRRGKIQIENSRAILWRCKIKSSGKGNRLILRKGSVFLNCEFVFLGSNNTVEFGEGCVAKSASFYTEDDGNTILTGDNTHYAGRIHIAVTESTTCAVGKGCLFSSDIVIRTGDSHSVLNEAGERINPAKDVVIGDRVWIGYRAMITKGVVIPENCVVGTGAVVTKPIGKSGAVVAGVPARIVKENIHWCDERL